MAIDEAILQAVNASESPATIRFYQWIEPTVSLGYFQKHTELLDQDEIIRNLPMVRRQTGGGAILHDDELTYSLVLPLNEAIPATDIEQMYQLVHDAYRGTLSKWSVKADYRRGTELSNSQRGPFFCFARKHRLDLLIGKDKLLGSAQRRVKNAVLQHGSLILQRHFQQQPSAELINSAQKCVDLKELIDQLITQISKSLGMTTTKAQLTDSERARLPELENKYTSTAWNHQR